MRACGERHNPGTERLRVENGAGPWPACHALDLAPPRAPCPAPAPAQQQILLRPAQDCRARPTPPYPTPFFCFLCHSYFI